MRFCLVELFSYGIRRPREDVCRQPPLAGELTVTDWPAGNAAGRALRVAQLREHYGGATLRDIVVPLFDPLLVRMTRTGFVLRGFQYHASDGVVREWMQEWWIRPVGAVGNPVVAGSSCEPESSDDAHQSLERHL